MTWKKSPPVGRNTLLALGLAIVMLAAPAVSSALEITIEIAPSTLNIESNGKVVTVHTDIAYSDVDVAAVFLGGVLIHSWKADDRGYFVAKFLIDEIKTLDGLVIGDYNTLTFIAMTTDGLALSGASVVMVIESGTGGNAE